MPCVKYGEEMSNELMELLDLFVHGDREQGIVLGWAKETVFGFSCNYCMQVAKTQNFLKHSDNCPVERAHDLLPDLEELSQ